MEPLSSREASVERLSRDAGTLSASFHKHAHYAASSLEGCSEGRIVGAQADDTAGEAAAGVAGSLARLALRADLAAVALAEVILLNTASAP